MHNTKAALRVTAVGAVLNVVLNFVLVPTCGLYGAAMATGAGYLYMVARKYFDTSKFTPIRMKVSRFFMANIILIIMCFSVFIKTGICYYLINFALIGCMLFAYRDQYQKVMELVLNKIQKKREI